MPSAQIQLWIRADAVFTSFDCGLRWRTNALSAERQCDDQKLQLRLLQLTLSAACRDTKWHHILHLLHIMIRIHVNTQYEISQLSVVWLDFLWSIIPTGIKTPNWRDGAWRNQSTEMQMDDTIENTTLISRKTQENKNNHSEKKMWEQRNSLTRKKKKNSEGNNRNDSTRHQLRPIREEEEEEGETEATAAERPSSSSSSSSSQSSSTTTNHRDTLLTEHPAAAPLRAGGEELQTTGPPTDTHVCFW